MNVDGFMRVGDQMPFVHQNFFIGLTQLEASPNSRLFLCPRRLFLVGGKWPNATFASPFFLLQNQADFPNPIHSFVWSPSHPFDPPQFPQQQQMPLHIALSPKHFSPSFSIFGCPSRPFSDQPFCLLNFMHIHPFARCNPSRALAIRTRRFLPPFFPSFVRSFFSSSCADRSFPFPSIFGQFPG